ncbi:MAG TPA: hypothetical protein VMD59_24545 [Acidimicrobiales bacterium]|nr:hypothetical protein [Acidimicrobiales bacterium]
MALAAVVALLLASQYLGRDLLLRRGLLPTRQAFTELYFTDPAHLPDMVTPGTTLHVGFVIVDEEDRGWVYHWSMLFAGSSSPLRSGTVVLPAGGRRRVTVEVVWSSHARAGTISVRLAEPREAIDFHVGTSRAVSS